jgi:hypothetical protein
MGQLFETEKKPITETDKLRLGADLARADLALVTMKEEKRDTSRAYRVKINELEDTIESLSRQLNNGVVEYSFEVEEVPDDARQMIVIMRKGTNQQINTRQMTEAEKIACAKRRQPELFDDDGNPIHDTERPPRGSPMRSPRAKKNGATAAAAAPKRNGKRSK